MNTLLIGCGSKFGLQITKHLLDNGHTVNSISGSTSSIDNKNLNHIVVNWKTLGIADIETFLQDLPEQDFILFNQNGSSLNIEDFKNNTTSLDLWKHEKDWGQTHFVSCVLPYHIIQTLGSRCNVSTKVGWLLSSLIYNHSNINEIGFADYCTNKYQNYLIMKNFSIHHNACFYGIDPGELSADSVAETIINNITTALVDDLNGTIRKLDFSNNKNFSMFTTKKSSNHNIPINNISMLADTSTYNTKVCAVELVFEISQVNNESMALEIEDQTFTNLPAGKFSHTINIAFPTQITISVSGKGENDTIIKDNIMIEDKFIRLDDIIIHGVSVPYDYLQNFIVLDTDNSGQVTSNYWGFNGSAIIDFNSPNEFLWLVNTKEKLDK